MITILTDTNSIASRYLYELRHKEIQQDRLRFRQNVERLGEMLAYEISKTVAYRATKVETSLGVADIEIPDDNIVIGSVLRAGVPLHNGFLRVFDHAGNAFFSAYRKHHKDGTFEIKMDYMTCPDLENAVFILVDPMLATGSSALKVLKAISECGNPKTIHFATVIASRYGVDYIQRNFPDVHLWTAAVDEELTAKSYIVPGLGDAGDLLYGPKVQE